MLNPIAPLARGLLRLVYPPQCLGCGALADEAGLPLCPLCFTDLERAEEHELRAHLDRTPGADALDGAFALWRYDKGGVLQKLHHALKYGNRPRYGVEMGRIAARAYAASHPLPDGLVPIPLHRARLLERGYNQSALLGEGAADVLGVPLRESLLRRPRYTETQTHFDRRHRQGNVRTAFAASPESADLHLLLIDDVLTTGATALAAASMLKAAGAASVHLLVVSWAR